MKKYKIYLFLQIVVLIYSLTAIPSKLASNEPFLSFKFCLYYGIVVLLLGIYAILWQQVIKSISLTIAYSSKATTIIWSMIIGLVFFKEEITMLNIIGAVVVIIGIIVMLKGEQENE